MKKPALFLDRDGVINIDYGYVHSSENFEFLDGIFEVVATASRIGYVIIVVTNQAGIGRGYYSVTQFENLTEWMKAKFMEYGGKIDAVYYCPHHREHGIGKYRFGCLCRKPLPGMLLKAMNDFNLDMKRSVLVGDKETDMLAGLSAGVGTLLHLGVNKLEGEFINIFSLKQVTPFLNRYENYNSGT